MALELAAAAGNGNDNQQIINFLRDNADLPGLRSNQRLKKRFRELGHLRPFRKTGNHRARVLKGIDLFYLALFNRLYPCTTVAQKQAFLFDVHGRHLPRPRFYSHSQIVKAEQGIGLSRVKVSTSANNAFSPRVLALREIFHTQNFPLGIRNVRRDQMIDVDEARIILDQTNPRYGKVSLGQRQRTVGHYKGGGRLLLMAISGDEEADRWLSLHDRGGTTLNVFIRFIRMILDDIGQGTPDNFRVFTMDNLNVHHDLHVVHMIEAAGHGVVYRAPYWPKDGPIEYFFNALEGILRLHHFEIDNVFDLENEIHVIVRRFDTFVPFFETVGFH